MMCGHDGGKAVRQLGEPYENLEEASIYFAVPRASPIHTRDRSGGGKMFSIAVILEAFEEIVRRCVRKSDFAVIVKRMAN